MFTPDFPFGGEKDTAYAWCEIKNNRVPIPLGGNYFYGNKFGHATLIYRGGSVHFGTNNGMTDSTLMIEKGADETALTTSVIRLFQKVERLPRWRSATNMRKMEFPAGAHGRARNDAAYLDNPTP
jgi:hypothetical protein